MVMAGGRGSLFLRLGDQCLGGLNFETLRPRADILRDYRLIVLESYSAENYFSRVLRVCTALDCSQKKIRNGYRRTMRELRGFMRLIWRMGVKRSYRDAKVYKRRKRWLT